MRVSLDWIKEFADVTASPEDVAHRLTMAGLEIEGLEPVGSDIVMEVNVTPNRPDCLSILGVAREAAAAYDLPLKLPETEIAGSLLPSGIKVEIDDPDLCARYTGRSILNVKVADSPDWLKSRLEKCGIRSVNNVVDVTNYVLLESGHPLHAFDADLIRGGKIRIARAGKDRSLVTLDSVERKPDEDTLLIWDAEAPVAVAGIMGGEGSAVTERTRNVFLESAWFSPTSIRKSSKSLGLKSESSYRFERGTDRIFLEAALNRAALLIAELGGGTLRDIVDVYPVKYEAVRIRVPFDRVNRLIGMNVDRNEVHRLLNRIGISTEDGGDDFFAVPPPFRGDLREPVDIIEEIARCYGYDRIPPRRPRASLSDGVLNIRERTVHSIRESIRRSGFCEVVNFSFMNKADLDVLSLTECGSEHRLKHVTLKNPLRQEECLMRTTLLPSLVRNFLYNLSRGVRDVRIFEISRVYIDHGSRLPSEGLNLCGLFFQDNGAVMWKDAVPPFFSVKGALETLFEEMRLRGYSMAPAKEVFLHDGKSADIYCGEIRIGFVGELAPQVIEQLDLKMHKPQVIVFELDIDLMISLAEKGIVYKQIPKYPSIDRDVALIIDDRITAAGLLGHFREFESELIENVELFDYYKGKNMEPGKKSLGVRVIYRSKDRTLAESEIEPVHSSLVDYVAGKTGAVIRGSS